MLVKAGQIIAIDSVKVDPTLSGDGVNSPLGVKAVAPTVSGHAGLSAENVNNTVYIGMEPDAVKVVSTNKSVSIEKTVKSDGTVEYNLGVSAKPIVSDTNIIGTNGISAQETAPATYTIGVSGNYVKSETLQNYYTKDVVDATFQPKGNYIEKSDLDYYYKKTDIDAYSAKVNSEFNETSAWAKSEFQPKSEMSAYYKKIDVYKKSEVDNLLDKYALSADVNTAIAKNEADIKDWANDKFQEKGNYAEKSDINSLSATVSANFQTKGKYVTSADASLADKALVLKNNKWEEAPEGTVYTSGPNIKIDGNSISGRDWSPELSAKADKSALESLATKSELNALDAAVSGEFVSTSAWAKKTFQLSGDYLTDEALLNYYNISEVDGKVEELSATIDRDFATKTELNKKLDKSETTNWDVKEYSAGNNYITIQNHKISGKDWSTEIDAKQDKLTDKQLSAISSVSAIQVISGDWATKTEVNNLVDNKAEELSATVSRDYLKKTDVKEYSAGDNIDITNYVISGRNWFPELDTKVNNTDFNTYSASTKTQIDSKVNNADFTVYSATVDRQITDKLDKSEFDTYSASTKTQIDSKVNNADFTVYSATVGRQISDKLDKSEFDTYSADIDSQLSTLYYKKSETSGANEISAGLGKKVDLPTSQQTGKLVYNATNKTWEAAPSGFDGVVTADSLSGNGTASSPLGLNTANIDPNKQYAWSTEGWKEVGAQSNLFAGTDLKIVNNVVQVNTNGIANSAGSAFAEGINTIASGIASHAEGRANSAYSDYSHIEGYRNSDYKAGTKLEANHTEGAYNQTSGVYAHVEGHANKLYGYGVHMQGGYNEFTIHNTSADRTDPDGRWNIWGISIEGMANATTAEPTSGTRGSDFGYVHGGILKVIGNGTRTKESEDPSSETITRSDALRLYRDGSMWVQGAISANGVELGNANDKVDLPDSSLANKWLIYSTLSGEQQPHGWADATNVFYTKSSSDGRYIKKGSEGLSLNIGSNNTVQNDGKCIAIGNRCNVSGNSCAVNDDNVSWDNSFAFGWKVKAKLYSLAGGHGDPASQYASTIAENYSMALGDACEAYNYSQAFGRGVKFTGNANGKGALAIGGWNKTQSDALFVVGNGTGNGNRGDALVVYSNGSIKEGDTNTVASINTHVEGVNNTDTGVTSTSFTPGVNHIEGGYNTSNGGLYNHIEGEANAVWGDRVHIEGNRNIYSAANYEWGVSVEGMANATSANTPNVHGGILKVIGNGRKSGDTVTRSDALRLYRDGSLWIQGDLNATKIANANGTDTVGAFSGINNIQVYPAGTDTSNFPNDGVLRIVLES